MFLEDVSEISRGSGKRVLVKCDSEQAEYCLGEVMRKYRDVYNNMDKIVENIFAFNVRYFNIGVVTTTDVSTKNLMIISWIS